MAEHPLLVVADSCRSAEQYHLTRFLAPDPFITVEHGDELVIVPSPLESGGAAPGAWLSQELERRIAPFAAEVALLRWRNAWQP